MQIPKLEEGGLVVGIKTAPSKDGNRTYTTYYMVKPWSEYELGRTDYGLTGYPVEEVQTTKDFPIFVGDIVKFYYGKAIGDYQPVEDFKMIKSASEAAKVSGSK